MPEKEEEENKELTPFEEFQNSIDEIPEDVLTEEEKGELIKNSKIYFEFLNYICNKYDITKEEAEKRYDKFASEYLQDAYEEIMVKSIEKFAEYNDYSDPKGLSEAFWGMRTLLKKIGNK